MKRENNKKFKKRKRNQNRSLTCRVLSMMFAIVLFCSTVLINTDYVSQASSFDDMVDMVEVEEDSAAVDTSEETTDDLGTDVNFESEESTDETYSESDDFGSSDADLSSGENMFTDGTSESSGSAPTEEAAQPVSCIVNLKNETIEIKAEAPAGVLPNGTQMIVKAVENNTEDAEMTDQYNKLAAKITEQLQSQGKNLDGFLAYNVSFTDADGNPVEPAGKVNYSFTYKEASSPELTDPAASTVTAAMIRTNKETSELELTELKAEEDQLTVETNESRQLTKAAFQSAATAAFTFVWSSTPAADDNENNENKEKNGEVNNEEVNADTNTENTEENGEETNTENNVENSEEEQNPEEAPDQEQIKMIRITADEVNLRVSPSTEADVIATVDTDTQLPLLETVTDEDEFTWYKVSYEEAEAYVRSDMAEVVETEEQGTENEDANEEAEVQVEDEVTYSQTIDNVVVTATVAKGVLPDDAQFVVTPIIQGTDQYAETENKLNEKAEEDGYEIAGFLAYDIFFQDNDGNKIEPVDGSVNVSMHYTEPSVPEEVAQVTENGSEVAVFTEEDEFSQNETTATQMDVTMMHLVEDENGNVNVVDMTQEGTASVETDAAGSVQKAEFETTSFSTFTITWKKNDTFGTNLIIKYVDEEGNEIDSAYANNEVIELGNIDREISLSNYKYSILNYEYQSTKLDSYDGLDVSSVRVKPLETNAEWNEERVPQVFSTNSNEWIDVKKSSVIYMVYKKITSDNIVSNLEVSHEKYIEKNENGAYDLTLNVAGSVETQTTTAKVDVVLVVDVSGSMSDNNSTKLDDTKNAIRALVNTFNEKEEKDNVKTRYQLVTFSNGANNVTENWIEDGNTFYNNYVSRLRAEGGTNYQQGLLKAKDALATADANATKIVIFLTDGEPTFYGNPEEVGKKYPYPYGRGDSTSDGSLTEALNEAHKLSNLDKFYAVGIGLGNLTGSQVYKYDSVEYGGNVAYGYYRDYYGIRRYGYHTSSDPTQNPAYINYRTGEDILNAVANTVTNAADREAINLSDSSELTGKFNEIAGNSTSFACSKVKIVDTLSDYVEPTDTSALNIKILRKGSDDKFETTPIKNAVGSPKLQNTEVNLNGVNITARYDSVNRQVILSFPDDYKLEKDYYYYVTITNLKPTQTAYDDYQKSGYNAAGDKLTDASEDKNSGVDGGSSSGQPGFYSNTEAKVTYTYKGQEKEVNYSKPVVQVVSSDLIKSKTAKVVDWDQRTYNITLNASSVMEEVKAANPVDVVLVFDKSGSMKFRSKLVKDKESKVSDLNKKITYYYIAPGEAATMYRVWYEGKNWYYLDDSKSSGRTKIDKDDSKILNINTEYQFYTDGDPGHDRLYYLREAATQFTTQLAQVSPKSKVALVSFANDSTVDFEMNELNTGNLSTLNGKINNLTTSSKTRQNEGLKTATDILNKNKSGNKQYVILLTDGCPNGDGCSYDTIGDAANKVKNITNNNGIKTTLMTVSVGLVENKYLETAKNNLKSYASKDSNGNPYSYDADSADQLVGIFKSILKSITAKAPITNVDVIDYIDPNFELTEQTKKDLTTAGVEYGQDAKGYYVKWSNQTIPEAGANGTAGWSKTIQVKAKDNFIGRNNIPTNGAGSGVIVKGQLLEFEQPHVNVKVKMEVANKTVTIYKGDEMPTEDAILNQLFDKTNTTTSYSASKVNANNVSITWYKDSECTNPVTDFSQLSDAEKKPVAETNYYIKVTYDAGVPSAESNQNTTTTDGTKQIIHYAGIQQDNNSYIESAVNKENANQKYGVYTVKVISGQIQITKKLVKNENNDPFEVNEDNGQTFTFKVTKLLDESGTIKKDDVGNPLLDRTFGTNGSKEVTVTIPKGKTQVSLTNSTELQNLPRGIYEVEEVNVPSFELTNAEAATETNCYSTPESLKVRFSLGYSKPDGTNVINNNYEHIGGGQLGVAVYTNKLVTADLKLKKVDADNTNTLLKGAEFELAKWTVSENSTGGSWTPVEGENKFEVNEEKDLKALLPGRYKLTETKAPDKHALLGSSIYFKVESGKVLLTNEDGTPANNGPSEMWTLAKEDNGGQVLTIKNTGIYELPSAGGNGIYWYMIGGMVLMSTAAWILYKNKCREVLRK